MCVCVTFRSRGSTRFYFTWPILCYAYVAIMWRSRVIDEFVKWTKKSCEIRLIRELCELPPHYLDWAKNCSFHESGTFIFGAEHVIYSPRRRPDRCQIVLKKSLNMMCVASISCTIILIFADRCAACVPRIRLCDTCNGVLKTTGRLCFDESGWFIVKSNSVDPRLFTVDPWNILE